jgi:hypothetical protein
MSTITVSTSLTSMTCPECAGVFAIAQNYIDEARRLGSFKQCWTCPYCKTQRGYGESAQEKEIARLKAEVAQQVAWKEQARARESDALKEAEHFRKSRDGMKGQLVKVQRRVKHGVCPCCQRTFQNLQKHMSTEHPTYGGETDATPTPTTP